VLPSPSFVLSCFVFRALQFMVSWVIWFVSLFCLVAEERGMWHVRETGEVHTGFWWRDLRERPRRGWEYNIKMNHQDVGSGGMDRIDLSQNRDRWRVLVNAVMNLRVP
jgi:hypothetical protein